MSGFDTSQPITDEKALEDVDAVEQKDKPTDSAGADAKPLPDELGDATPGPR
jgi:hypothetical protein